MANNLAGREMSVFYDKNEQHRILANDVEEYLAPIYRSESRFVVVLASKEYPRKIWTKFESEQFKQRFGENSVIPIWYSDAPAGMFDKSRQVGGITLDVSRALGDQVQEIARHFSAKLEEERQAEAKIAFRRYWGECVAAACSWQLRLSQFWLARRPRQSTLQLKHVLGTTTQRQQGSKPYG